MKFIITKGKYLEIPNVIRAAYNDNLPIEVLLKEFSQLKRNKQLKDLTQSEKEVYDLLEKEYQIRNRSGAL